MNCSFPFRIVLALLVAAPATGCIQRRSDQLTAGTDAVPLDNATSDLAALDQMVPADVECIPNCVEKQCGPDGCGGQCGTCQRVQELCLLGKCECIPNCEGKNWGEDGCGACCGNLEVCDGEDNDCDGLIDDDLGNTTCGKGVCNHTVDKCIDGQPQVCDPLEGAGAETCDGLDNDCDGKVDEELPQLACGKGQCFHTISSCVGGAEQECNPFEGAKPETCDGQDNDCNGEVDEGLGSAVCGQGVCKHEQPYCIDGMIVVCDPFAGASPETCDGEDNDCDGLIDEEIVCCVPSCGNFEQCIQATTGGWVCTAKMVSIPTGDFWMGCNNCAGSTVKDTQCHSREHPYHEVYLDAYEIDKTEVTAAQYLACKNADGCTAAGTGSYATYEVPGKEDHPLNRVNWSQAEDYCQWVGKELCTEAQWEKGARGGCEKNGGPSNCKAQSRKYPWGNEIPTCDLAVKSECDGDTQPVCSVSPEGDSPYGLCDMAGNVWEWTADWYASDYYCEGDTGADVSSPWTYCTECGSWPGSPSAWNSPFCTISGSGRVARGGSFGFTGDTLRVSYRFYVDPSGSDGYLGLRCCRSE